MIFELHSGIRKTNSAKLYNIFYMLVRIVLVGIVILLSSSDEPKHITLQGADLWVYYIEFLLFFIVNIICSAYLIFCWPFETRANNIIECCNQVCYTLIIVPLLFLKSESDWSKTGEDLYVFGLLIPTILSILVSLLYLLTLIIEKCLKYPKKKVVNARSKDYLKEESKVSGLSKSRLEKPATKISDAELRNAAREFHISRAINKRKDTED
ncbi:unnamed protein product [Moneuplotes crassus]|uniref:Uncharacterized protein n=1 Tax=Euplotes crassus TaxID=5936 RepID=A0AAD1XCZ1_EUPCR|nr:unnamed protein product [Moneuplotes crassus]